MIGNTSYKIFDKLDSMKNKNETKDEPHPIIFQLFFRIRTDSNQKLGQKPEYVLGSIHNTTLLFHPL